MIKSLITKELNITSLGSKFKKENLINTILELLIYAGFIVIEVYLFHMLTKKFQAYNGVEEAFLMIYLSIISIFLILVILNQLVAASIFLHCLWNYYKKLIKNSFYRL